MVYYEKNLVSFQDHYLISTLKVMAKVIRLNEKKLQNDVGTTT